MSYTAAEKVCNDMEMKRMAACFLNIEHVMKLVDWDKAAHQFDPTGKVKTDSFKTYMSRMMKKINEEKAKGGDGTPAADGDGGKGKKGKAAAGKRKKADAAAANGEEAEEAVEKPKTKRVRKTKVKSEEPEAEAEAAGAEGDDF